MTTDPVSAPPLGEATYERRAIRLSLLRKKIGTEKLAKAVLNFLSAEAAITDIEGFSAGNLNGKIPPRILSSASLDFGHAGSCSILAIGDSGWAGVQVRFDGAKAMAREAAEQASSGKQPSPAGGVKKPRGRPSTTASALERRIRADLKSGKLTEQRLRCEKVEALAADYGVQHQRISEVRKKILPEILAG